MPAPPLSVDPEGVKPEGRRSGMPWLDLTIAVTAIVLSLISLAVAIGNARTQEKMVAATSWPLLQYSTSNVGEDGGPTISMEIVNEGTGPALLKYVAISYGGRQIPHWGALLEACCGVTQESWARIREADPKVSVISSSVTERVIRPGERIRFVRLERRDSIAPIWARMDEARRAITIDACYCSLFEECWRSDLQGLAPERVRTCPPANTGYGQ